MKLSTSTNLLYLRPDNSIYSPQKAVEKIVQAGFRVLDFNFYDWVKTPKSPYMSQDGDDWLLSMREQADELGVCYEQAHAHFYDFGSQKLSSEEIKRQQSEVVRSIKNACLLGAKVVVLHPASIYDDAGNLDRKKSKELNIEYYENLLKLSLPFPIKIAIENMTDADTSPKLKYCARPEELIDLVDSISNERLGVCWDFEHGDLMKQNQYGIVHMLGKRLMATHVSDQHGFFPVCLTHRLPMTGNLNWEPILKALYEIEYKGCFSYEAHNYLNVLPDCAIDSALALAHDIGLYLMSLGRSGV